MLTAQQAREETLHWQLKQLAKTAKTALECSITLQLSSAVDDMSADYASKLIDTAYAAYFAVQGAKPC